MGAHDMIHAQYSFTAEQVDRRSGIVAILTAIVIGLAAAFSVAGAQTNLTFDKTSVGDGVWLGTVSGDVTGKLVTTMLVVDQSQPIWHVEFYWIVVADDPDQSFVARLTGTLDSTTGAVAMRGRVGEGYLIGATVREEGQLQDAETSRFTGTIRIVVHSDPYENMGASDPGKK